MIVERRKFLLQNNNENGISKEKVDETIDQIGHSKKLVFIDILLQATIDGKPLSNDEIIEEVDTLIFAVIYSSIFIFEIKRLEICVSFILIRRATIQRLLPLHVYYTCCQSTKKFKTKYSMKLSTSWEMIKTRRLHFDNCNHLSIWKLLSKRHFDYFHPYQQSADM